MKKYMIAVATFLLIAVVSNAQTQKQPSPAATKKPVAAHQHTSPVAKATTTTAATPVIESKKAVTPATAIKRKHHVVKNKKAMKTKAQ